jgi:hypothetical protein
MMDIITNKDCDGKMKQGKNTIWDHWFQKGTVIKNVKLVKNKYVWTKRCDDDFCDIVYSIPAKYCSIVIAKKGKIKDNNGMKNKHVKLYIKELKEFVSKIDDGDIDNAIENLCDEGSELGEALSDLRCAIDKVLELQ